MTFKSNSKPAVGMPMTRDEFRKQIRKEHSKAEYKHSKRLKALSDLVSYAIENRGKTGYPGPEFLKSHSRPYAGGSWAHYKNRLGTDKGTTYIAGKSSLAAIFVKAVEDEGKNFGFCHGSPGLDAVLSVAFGKAGIDHTRMWEGLPEAGSGYRHIEVDLTQPKLLTKISEAKVLMASWLFSWHLETNFPDYNNKKRERRASKPHSRQVIEHLEADLKI